MGVLVLLRAWFVATVVALVALCSSPGAAYADGAFPDSDSVLAPAALPHTIVLGTNFGVVSSVDDGQTWTWSCERPESAFASHYQLGAPPANRLYATALAGSTASLVSSGDGGCSWQVAGGGVAGVAVSDAFPDPVNAGRVLALISRATDAGTVAEAWESSDGGASFGIRRYVAAPGEQLTGIESAASDPSTVYLTLLGRSEAGGLRPQLAHSIDGGQSWAVHDLGALLGAVVNVRIIAVAPDDPDEVFLRVSLGSAGEAVAVTADGGATLTMPLTIAAGVLTAFARVPQSGSLIAGGDVGALFLRDRPSRADRAWRSAGAHGRGEHDPGRDGGGRTDRSEGGGVMSAAVEGLRTSELLRRASSELATAAPQLASELRVRARWIESGRADEGVSAERRQAMAMVDDPIEGADAQEVA